MNFLPETMILFPEKVVEYVYCLSQVAVVKDRPNIKYAIA